MVLRARAQVKANGLIVFVPKYGIEGPVYLTAKASADPAGGPAGGKGSAGKGARGAKECAAAEAAVEFVLDEEAQTVTSR